MSQFFSDKPIFLSCKAIKVRLQWQVWCSVMNFIFHEFSVIYRLLTRDRNLCLKYGCTLLRNCRHRFNLTGWVSEISHQSPSVMRYITVVNLGQPWFVATLNQVCSVITFTYLVGSVFLLIYHNDNAITFCLSLLNPLSSHVLLCSVVPFHFLLYKGRDKHSLWIWTYKGLYLISSSSNVDKGEK